MLTVQRRNWLDNLTVNVVDLEEEEDLLAVGLVGRVLVHGVEKLREGDSAVAILVEDLEYPLDEEGLKIVTCLNLSSSNFRWFDI